MTSIITQLKPTYKTYSKIEKEAIDLLSYLYPTYCKNLKETIDPYVFISENVPDIIKKMEKNLISNFLKYRYRKMEIK